MPGFELIDEQGYIEAETIDDCTPHVVDLAYYLWFSLQNEPEIFPLRIESIGKRGRRIALATVRNRADCIALLRRLRADYPRRHRDATDRLRRTWIEAKLESIALRRWRAALGSGGAQEDIWRAVRTSAERFVSLPHSARRVTRPGIRYRIEAAEARRLWYGPLHSGGVLWFASRIMPGPRGWWKRALEFETVGIAVSANGIEHCTLPNPVVARLREFRTFALRAVFEAELDDATTACHRALLATAARAPGEPSPHVERCNKIESRLTALNAVIRETAEALDLPVEDEDSNPDIMDVQRIVYFGHSYYSYQGPDGEDPYAFLSGRRRYHTERFEALADREPNRDYAVWRAYAYRVPMNRPGPRERPEDWCECDGTERFCADSPRNRSGDKPARTSPGSGVAALLPSRKRWAELEEEESLKPGDTVYELYEVDLTDGIWRSRKSFKVVVVPAGSLLPGAPMEMFLSLIVARTAVDAHRIAARRRLGAVLDRLSRRRDAVRAQIPPPKTDSDAERGKRVRSESPKFADLPKELNRTPRNNVRHDDLVAGLEQVAFDPVFWRSEAWLVRACKTKGRWRRGAVELDPTVLVLSERGRRSEALPEEIRTYFGRHSMLRHHVCDPEDLAAIMDWAAAELRFAEVPEPGARPCTVEPRLRLRRLEDRIARLKQWRHALPRGTSQREFFARHLPGL